MVSRSRVTRSLTRLSGSSKGQAPTSPAWIPPPATPQHPSDLSRQNTDTSPSANSILLHALKQYVSNFDQLCMVNQTPLSDPRVLDIRKNIEAAMPRVYTLADEKNSSAIANDARRVRNFAEEVLQRFPDINLDSLRLNSTSDNSSPPKSFATHSYQPSAAKEPPSTYAPSESHEDKERARKNYTSVKNPENTESQEREPDFESATASITREQRMVFEAIHDMFSDDNDIDRDLQSSSFRAPPAKSPEQLLQLRGLAGTQSFGADLGQFAMQSRGA